MARHSRIRVLIVFHAALLPASVVAGNQGVEFFESKVRPILVQRCEKCHGPKKQEGGLRLDQKSGWTRGGDQGTAIVPGKPEESLLIKAVGYSNQDLKMPPSGKLPQRELAALVEWVKLGAFDPRDGGPVKVGGMTLTEAKRFWSLQPLIRPSVPTSSRGGPNAHNPVDAFMLAGLEKAGLTPLPPADKRALIRRATYDLTGLPPTPEDVDRFINDDALDAFARVVDRLLASPHYGERWGRHWLDLVRYADTAGENTDHPLPHAWKYRNWVINAFNRDMPYDEFVRGQIAGDIMAGDGPPDAYGDRVVATGFLAIARRFGHDIDKDMYLTLEDVIDTTSKVFLGLSVGCARCHAHKYDPISAEDYYALYGIFDSTRFSFPGCEPNPMPRDLVPLTPEGLWKETIKPHQDRLAALDIGLRPLADLRAALAKRLAGLSPGSPRVLACGEIDDGGSQFMMTADGKTAIDIDVRVGQMLRLVVFARGNHGADSTKVEWEIDERGGSRRHWGLTRDALHGLLMRNPQPDAEGPRAAWYFVDARPGGNLLDESIRDLAGNAGLHAWRSGDTPSVFLNATDRPIAAWTSLPAHSFFVHPAADGPVGVAWLSPLDGAVTMSGRIADVHPGGPDGVAWRLECVAEGAAHTLAALGELATRQQSIARERALLIASQPRREFAYAVTEGTARDARLHVRGDPEKPGAVVPRRWLEVLGGQPVSAGSGSGRRQLAQWLTASGNPLAARVMVNRIWQYHFGKGLVTTPNDFGSRGQPPTHPELLDWLAAELVDSGWKIKTMHRLIMLSDAFQRSSSVSAARREVDPENRLYWRFNRARLSAEELRDSLLAVCGQLDSRPGGPHPFPTESTWSFTQHNPFSADYQTNRRAVYLMVKRNRRDLFLSLFDGADPNATTPERQETTVPTQALYVLNSSFFHDQSAHFADQILAEPDLAARLDLAFRLALQRSPTTADRARARQFLADYSIVLSDSPAPRRPGLAWAALARVLLGSNEFIYLD
jgi:hypothetical protein